MKAAAGRTGEQSSGVAEAAREATAGVHSVAAASEELAMTSSEIGNQMAEVGGIIRDAVTKGEDTRRVVAALNDAAQDIGNAADLIMEIAGQTNMLALNATIEAARAGEAGRGFTIVAEEVKILAGRTSRATDRIAARSTPSKGRGDGNRSYRRCAGCHSTYRQHRRSRNRIGRRPGRRHQSISRNATTAADGPEKYRDGSPLCRKMRVKPESSPRRSTIMRPACPSGRSFEGPAYRTAGRLARCGRMMDALSKTLQHFGEYGIFH